MSTRSSIAAKLTNGDVGIIYCHFDGYPLGGVGSTLQEHYQDQTKIEGLIALGNLSVLGASILCPKGHSFDNKIEGHCVAYRRDRGEKKNKAIIADDYEQALKKFGDSWQEYNYYWDGSQWFVGTHYPLIDVLKEEEGLSDVG